MLRMVNGLSRIERIWWAVETFWQIGHDDEFDALAFRPRRSGRSAVLVLANRSKLVHVRVHVQCNRTFASGSS